MSYQPLINGEAFSWSQVRLNILGAQPVGVLSISYQESEEMEDNFGLGNRPVSRGYGNITTEGSLEMYAEEIDAIRSASPTGRLQDIPEFDVIVSWVKKNGGGVIIHTLRNCRFKTDGVDTSQGDMSVTQTVDLQISHIEWTEN